MEDQVLPAAHASISLGDIIRYIQVISQVVILFEQARAMAVGASMAVPPIKADVGGKKYTLEHDTLTRTA